jgi:hypothetical protein
MIQLFMPSLSMTPTTSRHGADIDGTIVKETSK